ncbi:hypothetical protein FJTKL_13615 [Diaporthe vaccinii]|uniref:Uncharacterized protein n=1 Tax=Diaporthe vaccinii TaxID=105482 RepID=A0ABR4E9Z7_9PEZI
MADEGEQTRKKKSFFPKAGSVTVSAIGLILMSGAGEHAEIHGFTPNMYGATGGAKVKNRAGVPAPDQMRVGACRALYIPKHNGNMKGVLPVYDFTQDYSDKLWDENIGSDKWRYTLDLMRKPQGDGKDGAEVAYLVDVEEFNNAAEKQVINVSRRSLGATRETTTLSLPIRDSDSAFTFTIPPSAEVHTATMSHQVPPITTGAPTESCPGPWFTITSTESPTSYQWQVHPVEPGPLRYTLIELPSPGHDASAVEPENQHRHRALYHNVGVGTSLVQPFSEGVLLLPAHKEMDADLDIVVLTSLIGLLWKARGVPLVKSEVPGAKEDGYENEVQEERELLYENVERQEGR